MQVQVTFVVEVEPGYTPAQVGEDVLRWVPMTVLSLHVEEKQA